MERKAEKESVMVLELTGCGHTNQNMCGCPKKLELIERKTHGINDPATLHSCRKQEK